MTTPGVMGDLVEVSGGMETITPVSDIHFVCIRQMAYELLNSPELLKLAGYSARPPSGRKMRPTDGDAGGGSAQTEPDTPDESEPEEHYEPEVQRSRPDRVRLTNEDLERIREEVIRYFIAYYAELLDEADKWDPNEKLDYLRGHRHILFELGDDGAVIMHSPIEGDEDTFAFNIVENTMVRQLTDVKALKAPGGVTKSLHLDYTFGEDFGENTYLGPLVHKVGDVYYRTSWVQLDYASFARLDRWRDEAGAREVARQDLDFRLKGVY